MTLEQALRLTNRNMIAFDLAPRDGGDRGARGDPAGARSRRALARRRTPLPALRPDLAHLRRRPRRRRARAASSATGGRWPGCAGPRSPPTRSGPTRRRSAGPAPSSACASPASPTWRWPPASPGCRGDEPWATSTGCPSMRWSLRGLDRRGRRGLADPRHLPQALPLPRLPRRHRDRRRAHRRPVRAAGSAAPSTTTGTGAAPKSCWSPELRQVQRVPAARVLARRSSRRAAGAVGPATAPLSVSRRLASSLSLYARIGRTYCQLGPVAAAARGRRLRPARAAPRARRSRRGSARSTSAAGSRSSARSLRRARRSSTTGLLGEVFYTGAVAVSLTHPTTSRPPSLREIARDVNYGRLIAVDLIYGVARRGRPRRLLRSRESSSSSSSAWPRRWSRSRTAASAPRFGRSVSLVRGKFWLVLAVLLPIEIVGDALTRS